jgi:curli biogenesis system outer membrane secretion channel CsgG
VFKFFDMGTNSFEAEAGNTINEPVNYAVRVAIEQAVVELIKAGEKRELWKFKE